MTLSRECEETFELGSLLKSWRIRRLCLLGQLCLPQLFGSSLGVWEQEQPLLLCLSSFGNKSIMMCIEHAIRNTMRIKTRNLRRRIIFMVSLLSRCEYLLQMINTQMNKLTTSLMMFIRLDANLMKYTLNT